MGHEICSKMFIFGHACGRLFRLLKIVFMSFALTCTSYESCNFGAVYECDGVSFCVLVCVGTRCVRYRVWQRVW